MRYIKLFEDFSFSDKLEEAKWIAISHLGELEEVEVSLPASEGLKERLRIYRILGSPNVKDLNAFEEHMSGEAEGISWSADISWHKERRLSLVAGMTIDDFMRAWLEERFSDLKRWDRQEGKKTEVFYLMPNGVPAFMYVEGERDCSLRWDRVWFFFGEMGIEEFAARKIIKEWVKSITGLELEPRKW